MIAQGFSLLAPDDLGRMLATRPETDLTLVDVRQPGEYEHGHIPGARLIPLNELEGRLGELPAGRETVFYCAAGGRSKTAAAMASESGRFPKVESLDGGIRAWRGQKLPDHPPLKVFDEAQTYQETLQIALELEKGAWLFYTGLRQDPPSTIACATLDELAQAKREHAEVVYRHLLAASKDHATAPFQELFERTRGEILASGDSVELLLAWAKESFDDCDRIAELAVELENQAYDLYRNMAFDASTPEEERAFTDMAASERKLIQRLSTLFTGHKPPPGAPQPQPHG